MRTTRRFIGSLLGREQNRAVLESGMGIGCTCRGGGVGRCACEWVSGARRWQEDGSNEEAASGTRGTTTRRVADLLIQLGDESRGGRGQEKGIGLHQGAPLYV